MENKNSNATPAHNNMGYQSVGFENEDNNFNTENTYDDKIKDVKKKNNHVLKEIYYFSQSLISVTICVIIVFTFAFSVNVVNGKSMTNTLQHSDILVLNRICYNPAFGDIVVINAEHLLNYENGEMGEPIVKRVIGLPGDIIDFTEDGYVIRNGEVLKEDYVKEPINDNRRGDISLPYTVPENRVFLMGDNRNGSIDSRWAKPGTMLNGYVGSVEYENILGKVILRVYPISEFEFF